LYDLAGRIGRYFPLAARGGRRDNGRASSAPDDKPLRRSMASGQPLRSYFTGTLLIVLALARAAGAPEEDIDPSDLEIGQVGKIGTQGGKVSYYSLAENPIGDGEVIVEPRTKEGPGRPFIIRHVDVKKFPPGKAVVLDGRFKVVATRTHRDRFRYVLEPAK